jgi:glucose-6-phosphate isomerase
MRQGYLDQKNPNTEESVRELEMYGARIKEEADVVLFFGIGGSYLGNKVLFDLGAGPYWNSLPKPKRHGRPRIYFSGNNVDPQAFLDLETNLNIWHPEKQCARRQPR